MEETGYIDDMLERISTARAELRRYREQDTECSVLAFNQANKARTKQASDQTGSSYEELQRSKFKTLIRDINLQHLRCKAQAMSRWQSATSLPTPKKESSQPQPQHSRRESFEKDYLECVPTNLKRAWSTSKLGGTRAISAADYEYAIAEQKAVILDLNKDKERSTQDLQIASEMIKQLKRENATLAFQVKGLLKKSAADVGTQAVGA